MACRELFSVIVDNVKVPADVFFHAGMALAKRASDGMGVPAARSATNASGAARTQTFLGIAADDKAVTGNTMILADPVGANGIVGGAFVEQNNGWYVVPKRALGDYQNETVQNINNVVDGAAGYASPKRGVGVYTTPSSKFIIDSSVVNTSYMTATATTDTNVGVEPITRGSYLVPAAADGGAGSSPASLAGYWVKVANAHVGTIQGNLVVDEVQGALYFVTLIHV